MSQRLGSVSIGRGSRSVALLTILSGLGNLGQHSTHYPEKPDEVSVRNAGKSQLLASSGAMLGLRGDCRTENTAGTQWAGQRSPPPLRSELGGGD